MRPNGRPDYYNTAYSGLTSQAVGSLNLDEQTRTLSQLEGGVPTSSQPEDSFFDYGRYLDESSFQYNAGQFSSEITFSSMIEGTTADYPPNMINGLGQLSLDVHQSLDQHSQDSYSGVFHHTASQDDSLPPDDPAFDILGTLKNFNEDAFYSEPLPVQETVDPSALFNNGIANVSQERPESLKIDTEIYQPRHPAYPQAQSAGPRYSAPLSQTAQTAPATMFTLELRNQASPNPGTRYLSPTGYTNRGLSRGSGTSLNPNGVPRRVAHSTHPYGALTSYYPPTQLPAVHSLYGNVTAPAYISSPREPIFYYPDSPMHDNVQMPWQNCRPTSNGSSLNYPSAPSTELNTPASACPPDSPSSVTDANTYPPSVLYPPDSPPYSYSTGALRPTVLYPPESPLANNGTGVERSRPVRIKSSPLAMRKMIPSSRTASPAVTRPRKIPSSSPPKAVLPSLPSMTSGNLRLLLQDRIDRLASERFCNSDEDEALLSEWLSREALQIEHFGRTARRLVDGTNNKNRERGKKARSNKKHSSPTQPAPYICFSCSADFTSRQNLFKHLKAHLKLKTPCDSCGFKFAGDLARHKRTCTGA